MIWGKYLTGIRAQAYMLGESAGPADSGSAGMRSAFGGIVVGLQRASGTGERICIGGAKTGSGLSSAASNCWQWPAATRIQCLLSWIDALTAPPNRQRTHFVSAVAESLNQRFAGMPKPLVWGAGWCSRTKLRQRQRAG